MSTLFNLSAAFTDTQLEAMYETNSSVIVAKPSQGESPNVAWQVFKPFEANTLSWYEKYGIYVTTSEITNGAELVKLSSSGDPASTNMLYTLQDSGVISNPIAGGQPDSFALLNDYSNNQYLTVGLYQDATVNGTATKSHAVSAAPVLYNSTAIITPYTYLYIWIQSQVKSNTVVTKVTSPTTVLKFGGTVSTISVNYDSKTGKFIQAT